MLRPSVAARKDLDIHSLAVDIVLSVSLFRRHLFQLQESGDLSSPQRSALARLERGGPMTAAALARLEQISGQSIGTTLKELKAQGLVQGQADPSDGRQTLLSPTAAGVQALRNIRNQRTERAAEILGTDFTPEELEALRIAVPLIERLAQHI